MELLKKGQSENDKRLASTFTSLLRHSGVQKEMGSTTNAYGEFQ